MLLTNNPDPLNLSAIFDSVKQLPKSSTLDKTAKNELLHWTSWMEKQQKLYLKEQITVRQYLENSHAFANFLHKKYDLKTPEIINLIEKDMCPICLTRMPSDYKKIKQCPHCRMPLPSKVILDSQLPAKQNLFSSFLLFFKVLFSPKEVFRTAKYDSIKWYHPLLIFLISCILLILSTNILIPKFSYTDLELTNLWQTQRTAILLKYVVVYPLINLILLFSYSLLLFLLSKGSYIRLNKSQIFQATSLILIPKMIFFPLFTLIYQLATSESYFIDRFTSIEEASWWLLNISDYSGPFIMPIEAILTTWVFFLMFLYLVYTWKIDFDDALRRILVLSIVGIVLVYGVPMYL